MVINTIMSFISKKDKQKHITVSMLLMIAVTSTVLACCNSTVALCTGIVVTLGIGVGKEYYDGKHPDKHTKDIKDIYADIIGILIGFVIMYIIVKV